MTGKRGTYGAQQADAKTIRTVRFLGHDWVVTRSYKSGAVRFYDLVGASYDTHVSGMRLRKVSKATIIKHPEETTATLGSLSYMWS